MRARAYDDPAEFRRFADPLLLEGEARNNLILGVTGVLITRPEIYPEFHLWAVEEEGEPLAAAAMTPPRHLLLADPATDDALDYLAREIAGSEVDVPGVIGNEPAVSRFVTAWAETTGTDPIKEIAHGVFAASSVNEISAVEGTPRPATVEDIELLIEWVRAFLAEADPTAPTDRTEITVRSRMHGEQSDTGYWIWEVDGAPVSLTGHGGPTPSGIRIGPVYTPERYRRHGYATALVAAQSAWLLAQGHRYCFLYTDLANPTANAIYRTIGYEQVAEAARYSFPG